MLKKPLKVGILINSKTVSKQGYDLIELSKNHKIIELQI